MLPRLSLRAVWIGAVSWIAAAAPVVAQQSTYEREHVADVLERDSLEEEPHPEGKTVEFVRFVRDEVFVEGEILPEPILPIGPSLTMFNKLHWLTRESTVAREMLIREGEPYREVLVEESMRILRSLRIFSLVRIAAVKTKHPDRVGVIVYTRDLWSLRVETDFQVTGEQIDQLFVQVIERNFLGRQKAPSVRFVMVPDTYRLGQAYEDRRVNGSMVRFGESADLIFNRATGNAEGMRVEGALGVPFYRLSQKYGFSLSGGYDTEVERQLRNGVVLGYDDPETAEEEQIPQVWRQRDAFASLLGSYRTGSSYKATFSGGFAYLERMAAPNAETGISRGENPAFDRDVLPRERRQIGPVVSYELFTPNFVIFENLDSFGVSENVRVGPRMAAVVRFPLSAFGSSTDSITFSGLLNYAVAGRDALGEVTVNAFSRLEDGNVVDQFLSGELRWASPMWRGFRVVGRLGWEGRRNDTSRTQVSLGGDNGLRGFVSQAFVATGANLVRGNLELRSRPLNIKSVHVGAVLFYDTGAVYERLGSAQLHHSVGVGIRLLLPQFNRLPFRADGGLPLGEEFQFVPSFGSSQTVTLTNLESAVGF